MVKYLLYQIGISRDQKWKQVSEYVSFTYYISSIDLYILAVNRRTMSIKEKILEMLPKCGYRAIVVLLGGFLMHLAIGSVYTFGKIIYVV